MAEAMDWKQLLLFFGLFSILAEVEGNSPPRFLLDELGRNEMIVKLKEGDETPVGSVVYRVKAFDADGDRLTFALLGTEANQLLRVEPIGHDEAHLILNKQLDRETEEEYSLVLTVTDGVIGEENAIKQSLLILVEDVNDNAPVFQPFANTLLVEENSAPAVILTVHATDRDQGVYGQVVYSVMTEEEEDLPFNITTVDGKGVLRCTRSLDYEYRSWYQLMILAKDRANQGRINTATAGLLVRVVDKDDQGPEFITVPWVTRVSEDTAPGSSIVQVKAIDSDHGINAPISYGLIGDHVDHFVIDPNDGTVYLTERLDREHPNVTNGALVITVVAWEGSKVERKITTSITILVLDVNDHRPTFSATSYRTAIEENSAKGMPVTFEDVAGMAPRVYDLDAAANGTFTLSIDCGSNDVFEVTPTLVVNEAEFSVRVKNQSALDYERLKTVNCTITARELVAWQPKVTIVRLRIDVTDVNDNVPQFSLMAYHLEVFENAPAGTVVGSVWATDEDSGPLGTDGIRYSLLEGSGGAERLEIDPVNGSIRIAPGASIWMDREKVTQLFVMVQATDSLGVGNRNSVQVTLQLLDVNDNPPVYVQNRFETYINENEPRFPYTFRIEAFDNDLIGSANSEIRYSIIDGNDSGNFSIDAVTGEMSVAHPLDFERIPPLSFNASTIGGKRRWGNARLVNVTVRASDSGLPALFSDTIVSIDVRDVNDFPPVFSQSSYDVMVAEDVPAATSIFQVEATDADGSAPNNRIAYRIQSGAMDKFVIDSDSGTIRIAEGASLDPDQSHPRRSRYQLHILALDGGIDGQQLHASARVTITVQDVNNKAPVLLDPSPIHVKENVPIGVILTQLSASDADENPVLRYWIDHAASEGRSETGQVVRDNVTAWFELNGDDGRLRVVRQLDREKAEIIRLVVRVEDTAAANSFQTASATVTIVIDDVNDHDPVFGKTFYRRSLPENSKRGAPILTVSADDADINRTITYNLQGPVDVLELVELDSETGEVVVAGKIDRERFSWINLTVKASDSGVPIRSSFVPLYIQVLDENDNNPQFVNVASNWSVAENVPLGTVIGSAHAYDADVGDFGHVTYLMDRRSSKGRFSIDPESGAIMVTDHLDREEQQQYTLIVEAWDNYKFGYAAGESRNAFQQVTVIIQDENDQVPAFLPFAECVSVTEFHDARQPMTTVRAQDRDDHNTPNGQIMFSIEAGNDQGLFGLVNVDYWSSRLFAVKSLVGHHGNYTLRIQAQDRGTPANIALQEMNICVSDFNDHSPRFVWPQQNTTLKVFENTTVGSVIGGVSAVDDDVGLNSRIRYMIRPDPAGHHKWFRVDNVTGVLTLGRPLDREKQKFYQIRVEARDSGVPTWLSTDLDLVIYVRNVDDCPPQFLVDVFQVNFTEHGAEGSQSIKLPSTVDLDDPDDPTANRNVVCYFIVRGNQNNSFSLDPIHHILRVEKGLDREEEALHILVIKASEKCQDVPETIDFFDPSDDTLLKVVVNVEDINDNRPVFTKDMFTGGFTTEAHFGTQILCVSAVDADSSRNAMLHYYLTYPIQYSLQSGDGAEHIGSNPFIIDKDTGCISLNFDPQRNMKGYFHMQVNANDSGGLNASAHVYVYLLRQDQRIKFVLRQHPQLLRARIDIFREILGNITKSIVNVDEFKVHLNEEGLADKTRTDVYLHFVNEADNSILEVETVLRLIDANIESLDQLFKDFNVLDTSPAEALLETSSTQQLSLVWASGTAVFLAVILFLVLGLCLSQRVVLLRKLKAASTTTFGSQSNLNRNSNQVPNTNQHSVEGSNPVWRRDVEPEWLKHDDLYSASNDNDGLDSLDVNAILGSAPSTSRNSSAANTASLKSTAEAFNRGMMHTNVLSIRSSGESIDNVTLSEKECEIGEVKEDNIDDVSGKGITYQRNVYHFGYPVFQDKAASTFMPPNFTTRKLETTEL